MVAAVNVCVVPLSQVYVGKFVNVTWSPEANEPVPAVIAIVTTLPAVSVVLPTVAESLDAAMTFCIVQVSAADAPRVKYVPARLSKGLFWFTPRFVAAVVFAHDQAAAEVWLKVVAFVPLKLSVPEFTVTAPVVVALPEKVAVPAFTVRLPMAVVGPEKVAMPPPSLVTVPVPRLTLPLTVVLPEPPTVSV